MDIPEEIKKLVALKEAGHLTETEFDAAKQRLLAQSAPVRAPTANPAKSPFRGPPHECWNCGGKLKKGGDSKNEGTGCIVAIMGLIVALVGFLLVLTPLGWFGLAFGGIVFLLGLNLCFKREGFWRCKKCGSKFPREIRSFELG